MSSTSLSSHPRPRRRDTTCTEDLADRAIAWVRQQKALTPDKPFFAYFAPGATHAPHHVPLEWADKYQGAFDDGWDKLRERTFARQKELGVIPQDAELTRRHPEIPAWEEMDEQLTPVLRRQMEVYAGFLEHTDHHIGRLLHALKELGVLDDTLVYVIIGDNGASAEGTLQGTFNEVIPFNGMDALETPEFLRNGWTSWAAQRPTTTMRSAGPCLCTPYQWTKQVPPTGAAPATALSSTGRTGSPLRARGVTSSTTSSTSPRPCWRRPACAAEHSPRRHPGAHRGRQHGLQLRRRRRPRPPHRPVLRVPRQPRHLPPGLDRGDQAPHAWELTDTAVAFDDDVWELYDTTSDWTQANDLAKQRPEKLHDLQRLFLIEATKYNVFPLDDRGASGSTQIWLIDRP